MSRIRTRYLALAIVMLTVSSFAVIPASEVGGSSSGDYEVSSIIRDATATGKLLDADYMGTGFSESEIRDTVIDVFSTYFDTNGISVANIMYSDSARYFAEYYSKLKGTESKDTRFLRFSDESMDFDLDITGGCRLFPTGEMYTDEIMNVVNDFGPAIEWPASLTIHVDADCGFERYEFFKYDRERISDGQYFLDSIRIVNGQKVDIILCFELFGKNVVLEHHVDEGFYRSMETDLNGKHLDEMRDGDTYSKYIELDDLVYSHSDTIRYGNRTAGARPDGMDKAEISKIRAESQYCTISIFSSTPGGLPEKPSTGPFTPDFQDVVDSNTPGITVNNDVSEFRDASADVSRDIMLADKNKTMIIGLVAIASIIAVCGILYILIKKRD